MNLAALRPVKANLPEDLHSKKQIRKQKVSCFQDAHKMCFCEAVWI